MSRCIAVYSGGLDSSVLVAYLARASNVTAVSFNYGQRHARELEVARANAREVGASSHVEIDISSLGVALQGSGCSQIDDSVAVPDGHYAAESMRATVVPNRNMVMIACATSLALAHGAQQVAYGAHGGDHFIYADCRPGFVAAMQHAMRECATDSSVDLIAPFLSLSKGEIVRIGAHLKVPMHKTYSCYKGGALHCGKCGTCVERKEAFASASVIDRTEYAQ